MNPLTTEAGRKEGTQKLTCKELAVIVKLDNGACHQLALTSEQVSSILNFIPTLFDNGVALVLPEVLMLDLETKVPEVSNKH